jgi:VanZ family protein
MQFLYNYWKSVLLTLIILVLSFAKLPALESIPKVSNLDKLVHFLMYLSLTLVLIYDFTKEKRNDYRTWRFVLICLLFPFLLGGITELLQSLLFVPRVAEWWDWISNSSGVLVGWGVYVVYKRSFKT